MNESRASDAASMDHRALDELFLTLADQCRRHVLWTIDATAGPCSEQMLVDAVAEWRRAAGDSRSDVDLQEAVAIQLQHVHLPRLLDRAFVERAGDGYTLTPLGAETVRVMHGEFTPWSDD